VFQLSSCFFKFRLHDRLLKAEDLVVKIEGRHVGWGLLLLIKGTVLEYSGFNVVP